MATNGIDANNPETRPLVVTGEPRSALEKGAGAISPVGSNKSVFYCLPPTIYKELKTFINLASPFALSTAIVAAGNFVSARFLAELGDDELAASGLITSGQLLTQGFFWSPLFAVGILAAISKGANLHDGVLSAYQNGLIASLVLSIPIIAFCFTAGQIFELTGQKKSVARIAGDFFTNYGIGCYGDVFLLMTQQYALAVGEQYAVLFSTFLEKAITVGLSYYLLFGKPKLGASGLGYSYSAAAVFTWLAFTVYLAARSVINISDAFNFSKLKSRYTSLVQLIKVGAPIGFQVGIELAVLSVLLAFSGVLSPKDLIAAEVVFQYTGFILVPIIGVSQATGMLVGMAVGSSNPRLANRYANIGYALGMVIPIATMLAMIFAYEPLTNFFIDTNNPENSGILSQTKTLFIINGVAMLPDFVRNVSLGTLRGLMDTNIPMWVNTAFSVANVIASYLLAFQLDTGNEGIYSARAVAIGLIASTLTLRWGFKIYGKISEERSLVHGESERLIGHKKLPSTYHSINSPSDPGLARDQSRSSVVIFS